MFYLDIIAKSIGEKCELSMTSHLHLLRLYALLCKSKGTQVTNEDVHDAWAINKVQVIPKHSAFMPYDQLTTEIQERDTKYRNAIRMTASEFHL